MRKIGFLLICLIMFLGCTYQKPMIIEEPTTPRIIIKPVPAGPEKKEKEEYFESDYYPDWSRGYIEIRSLPDYLPEVWLLVEGGQKVLLIGSENGPLEFSYGQIQEFNFPPLKDNILHVYRWKYFPYYGGWRKIRYVEIVKVSVAKFPKSGVWQTWQRGHYGWRMIIWPNYCEVWGGYIN